MSRTFRKLPVEIQAIQYDGTNADEILAWAREADIKTWESIPRLSIPTLEGWMYADQGDWIVKGVAGEFYPCKPDIFDATYEEVT